LTKPYDSKILLEHIARAMKLSEQCPSTAPVLQLWQK